jgi:hypothetical protein
MQFSLPTGREIGLVEEEDGWWSAIDERSCGSSASVILSRV